MEDNFNKHLGNKLKLRRLALGLTQTKVAHAINVTFQQIQKYETGMNRVSASRLWDIAHALDVSVPFFFEGMDQAAPVSDSESAMPKDILGDKEALELLRSYYAIPENQRRRLFDLARVLSDVA